MTERRRLFRDEAFARRGRTEPIDGLMRITAPHEWLFLGLLGVALSGVVAWAMLGTIERGFSADCEITSNAANRIEVVAEISAGDAIRVHQGMTARVAVLGPEASWEAQVREVRQATSSEVGRDGGAGAELTHRVWLAGGQTPSALTVGQLCSARIVLSREAPFRLIAATALE